MKKLNKNIFLFIFFAVFVVLGFSGSCFGELKAEVETLYEELSQGNVGQLASFKYTLDNLPLSYRDTLIDVNSMKDNLLGTKISIEKLVAKSEDDRLITQAKELSQDSIQETVDAIARLRDVSEAAGADFLYFAVSNKEYYEKAPGGFPNFEKQNYDEFIRQLGLADIPYISFTEYINANGINGQDVYYKTDHHWKTYYGFEAAGMISESLNALYGVPVYSEYTDINNYKVETYPEWFLGSYGKKVGAYFTWSGVDDFDLITPEFETDFSEEVSLTNEVKQGSFESIMLKPSNLNKDFYNLSPYNTYMATNGQRVRVIKNNSDQTNGKRVLIVQTSFGQVASPFLAIQNKETYICDLRTDQSIKEPEINLKDYIDEIKPDVVLVLYNSVYKSTTYNGTYDFFNEQ